MPISELVGADLKQWQRVRELQADGTWKDWQRAWELQADGSFKEIFSTGGLLFIDDAANVARAYDLERNRRSGDDINLGTGRWEVGAVAPSRLYFIDFVLPASHTASAFTRSGSAVTADNITLGTGDWSGGYVIGNRLYFVYSSSTTGSHFARAWTLDGSRASADDVVLNWTAAVYDVDADDDRIYLLVDAGRGRRAVMARTHAGVRDTNIEFNLPAGKSYRGVCAVEGGIYVVNDTDNQALFYNIPANTPNSALDISLGTGNWRGALALT